MKRWMKTVLILALVAVASVSMLTMALMGLAPASWQPNVGWNTGATTYEPAPVAFSGITIKPYVGWNT